MINSTLYLWSKEGTGGDGEEEGEEEEEKKL